MVGAKTRKEMKPNHWDNHLNGATAENRNETVGTQRKQSKTNRDRKIQFHLS